MNQFRNVSGVLATILAVMILFSSLQSAVYAQGELDPIVIIFDASHSPQFAPDDNELGLQRIIDLVNASTNYIIKINDAPITESLLNDADILIIAAPDETSPFSAIELKGISEMLENGSSLFLLGDPALGQQSTYWEEESMHDIGDNIAINRLLDGINMTGVRFSINVTITNTTTHYWSDTLFDYDHSLNETKPWVVKLDATTWDTTHPIFRNINELYTITATLKPIELASGVAHGYKSSFAQYQVSANGWANYSKPNMTLEEYSLHPNAYSALNATFPSWLSAFEYGSSRVVICGSTIMFTSRLLDLENTELQWVSVGDNAKLFANILGWLSKDFVQSPSAIVPMVIISSVIMIVGVAYYLLKKLR
jgi:hypothetical protein